MAQMQEPSFEELMRIVAEAEAEEERRSVAMAIAQADAEEKKRSGAAQMPETEQERKQRIIAENNQMREMLRRMQGGQQPAARPAARQPVQQPAARQPVQQPAARPAQQPAARPVQQPIILPEQHLPPFEPEVPRQQRERKEEVGQKRKATELEYENAEQNIPGFSQELTATLLQQFPISGTPPRVLYLRPNSWRVVMGEHSIDVPSAQVLPLIHMLLASQQAARSLDYQNPLI